MTTTNFSTRQTNVGVRTYYSFKKIARKKMKTKH